MTLPSVVAVLLEEGGNTDSGQTSDCRDMVSTESAKNTMDRKKTDYAAIKETVKAR